MFYIGTPEFDNVLAICASKKQFHLILRKIFKFLATRCQILNLKCTKFSFCWGSAPDPVGGAYSAPPDLLAGFKGPTSRQGKGMGGGRRTPKTLDIAPRS